MAKLPLARGAQVQLLHVIPDDDSVAADRARSQLELECERLQALTEPRAEMKVATGEAWAEIVRAARTYGAELVVVGPHSKQGRLFEIGSTAREVIRRGSAPVLVVKGPATLPYRRPLVALDLSDVSRSVLDAALLAVDNEVAVRLVHAYHVPFEGYVATSSSRADLDSFRRHYRDEARARMSPFVANAEQDASRCAATIRQGEACSVIAHEVARRNGDLVVVGTHGRTGFSHLLLGSVAQWLLENAPCDVLVGRPERFSNESG